MSADHSENIQKQRMISIILPTYNERENLEVLIPMICNVFRDKNFEIIIVDDSSPDGTEEYVKNISRKNNFIRLITRKKERGIGSAISEGYNSARGDIIISSDADLSLDPADMLRLLEIIDNGFDVVVGSKYLKDSVYEKKSFRKFLQSFVSRCGNIYIRALLGVPLTDFTLNFRAFRKPIWNNIATKEKDNVMLLEMLYKAHINGYKIVSIPVKFSERKHGVTKFKFFGNSLPFLVKTTRIGFKRFLTGNKEW